MKKLFAAFAAVAIGALSSMAYQLASPASVFSECRATVVFYEESNPGNQLAAINQ